MKKKKVCDFGFFKHVCVGTCCFLSIFLTLIAFFLGSFLLVMAVVHADRIHDLDQGRQEPSAYYKQSWNYKYMKAL